MTSFLCLSLLVVGDVPTAKSEDFSKAQQISAIESTVRISDPTSDLSGSGVLVAQTGPFAYVLTAKHVVENTRRLEIRTFTRSSYPKAAKVYKLVRVVEDQTKRKGPDLALVKFVCKEKLPLLPIRTTTIRKKRLSALAIGCGLGKEPTPQLVHVLGKKTVRKAGQSGQAHFWKTDKKPIAGRSGGPLISEDMEVIGICSIAVGQQTGFYAHLDEIHSFLRLNGLRWLYSKPR